MVAVIGVKKPEHIECFFISHHEEAKGKLAEKRYGTPGLILASKCHMNLKKR
jgi:hypothetical protein